MDTEQDTVRRGRFEFGFISGRSPGRKHASIFVQFYTELYFLIAKFLASGPCQRSAKVSETLK